MKQFKVFKHPAGEIQAVKIGWCWPAFGFGGFWAMFAKMWALGVGVLVVSIALEIASQSSGSASLFFNIASIFIAVLFGINGNQWRANNLVSRGFDCKDTVSAANKDGAVAVFLNNSSTAG
jgi:hypothetical protein